MFILSRKNGYEEEALCNIVKGKRRTALRGSHNYRSLLERLSCPYCPPPIVLQDDCTWVCPEPPDPAPLSCGWRHEKATL